MTKHNAEPQWQAGWHEWLAVCTCGWRGDYLVSKSASQRNADAHMKESEASDDEG